LAWWWLFTTHPPTIEADVPPGPLRGALIVPVDVRPAGRVALLAVAVDGAPLGPAARLPSPPAGAAAAAGAGRLTFAVDTAAVPDGTHRLRLEAVDRSRRRNRTVLEREFTSDNTPPKLTLETASPRLRAGSVGLVRIAADEPATLRATWAGEPLPLVPAPAAAAHTPPAPDGGTGGPAAPSGPAFLAFVAAATDASTGELPVAVAGADAAGNAGEAGLLVGVEPVARPRQVLVLPPALAGLAAGPVAGAEAAQLWALTSAARPERLWSGAFRAPVPEVFPRTTGFGDRRDYADGHVAYHAGYDIAAPLGTPAAAAAGGVVVFAGALPQRGNTIVVDHGWGIATLYAHLSQIEAQVGQPVAPGQPVGLVGSTGLSTGPHLHWEVRLRGQPVDPASWLALSRDLP
jgi:murein DD-endopeptidase MepM/ murein hydrolase activator NlpD